MSILKKILLSHDKEFRRYMPERKYHPSDKLYVDDDVDIFKVDFGICDGNHGAFIGTTKEIRQAIDKHIWDYSAYYNNSSYGYKKEWELRSIADNMSILKYGYFWECKEKYVELEYTIDNAFSIKVIKVNRKDEAYENQKA